MTIRDAATDEEILAAYPVMAELRPHLIRDEFVERVRRQQASGYVLTTAGDDEVLAAAGWRFGENLAWGRFLYIDDLVTATSARSRGFGGALLDHLVERARTAGCDEFHLDSGVQRFGAHRFYLAHRLDITSHHFARKLR